MIDSILSNQIPLTADIQARIPEVTGAERSALIHRIKALLKAQDAALVAHYYTHEDLQQLSE